MRFSLKILVVSLVVFGYVTHAIAQQQKPQKPKLPVTASIEDFPPLWSLQPLKRPPVPAGAANPIDAFVQSL